MRRRIGLRGWAGDAFFIGGAAAACLALSGCLVAGYSSQGGWWIWPGSIVVTLLFLLLMFVLNRR